MSRGVLLPGALNLVTLFFIISHLQLLKTLNFDENYDLATTQIYARIADHEKSFSDHVSKPLLYNPITSG